jgi:hypothetical protein
MAARANEVRDRWLIRGGRLRRVPASADRRLLGGIRTVVAIVLVVLALAGMAGFGALVGATGMPVDGPAPGFP